MSMENRIFCDRSSAEVNTEYSCFFVPKVKGPVCPASGNPWFLFRQQAIFSDVTLPCTLCLQLNHATDVILPLFPSTLIWTVASHLKKHVETL